MLPLAGGIGASLALERLDSQGRAFFETGHQVVTALDRIAAAARTRDFETLGAAFSNNYSGGELGLVDPSLASDIDGIQTLRFHGGRDRLGRDAALAEWSAYLRGFDSIETFELHVHHLDDWAGGAEIRATIRMEVIATPCGKPEAGIDRAYLRATLSRGPEGLRIASLSLEEGDRIIGERPQFRDVAREAGIDFANRYYPGFLNGGLKFKMLVYGPAGISAVDYDNDGRYDLFIPDGVESRLFHNEGGGRFADKTALAGLSGLDGVSVGVFADYDNDGRKDLFVSRTFRPNQLFHNEGHGRFIDVTARSGIGEDCCTTVASWGDYDNDGYLDLYVGRYLDPRAKIPSTFYARNGEGNRLYHNNGNGTFTDVTAQAGVGDPGLCLGTVFGDYDDDGYPDLYVVNDFGRKTLYRNNRNGTFTDVTVASGTLAYGAGMSASFADYDNDGRLDLYCTNIRSEHAWYAEAPTVGRYMLTAWRQGTWRTDLPLYLQMFRQSGIDFVKMYQQMASGNTLLRNRGDGTFEDVTVKAGANPVGWFWGASFADFDNDGWQDIYAADGWVYGAHDTEIELEFLNNVVTHQNVYKTGAYFDPQSFGGRSWHGYERNRHLRNNGDGTFAEIGRGAGTDLVLNSRGVAVADFFNRGVMDIAVAASGGQHALLRNEISTRRNWLEVELVGVASNRDAVGARLIARSGGQQQMREVVLGDGYGSQNSLRQHFGLAGHTQVDELTVRWPRTGAVQTFRNLRANQIIEITEGTNTVVEQKYETITDK
jgi:hypothetical protein